MMGNNNKILTVSYGTFSCTLEGFDDSFDTMKAIAEYFRDLAADDRYFGATPPTPDAEMLARIAEKEVARRVEAAAQEDGSVFLKAAEAAPIAAAPLVSAPVADPAPEPEAESEPEPVEDVAEEPVDAPVIEETEPVVAEDAVEEDAPTIATDVVEATVAEEAFEDEYEDESEADILASIDNVLNAEPVEAAPEAPVEEAVVEDAEAAFEDEPAIEAIADEPVVEVMEEAERPAAPSSIAERLQRIRAVVNKSADVQEEAVEATEYLEDEHADDLIANVAAHIADEEPVIDALTEDEPFDFADAPTEAVEADVVEEVATPVEAAEIFDADVEDADDDQSSEIANVLAELAAQSDAPAVVAQDDTAEELERDEIKFEEDQAEKDELDEMLARIEAEEEEAEPAPAETAAEPRDNVFGDTLNAEAPAPEPEAAPKPPVRRARVIKVRRADLQKAVDEGVLEDAEAAEETPQAGSDHIVAADESAPEQAFATDVNRLMDEADVHMEEPESTQRRNAFQALKAAVAARKADKGMSEKEASESAAESDAYKSDLEKVVRPRRPATSAEASERPEASARPAPLRLVAEQRVDREAADAGPVQPRRVTEEPEQVEAKQGFAAYADEKGAHSLPDLLEAAACYLSFVEGKEQFSRPQLMTKVRHLVGEDFSREEGLRSFGQLLRAGKIAKIHGGRFQVTDETGFRPDQRAAG